MDVFVELRRYLTKPHVRPWALSAPILVLLFCLPLLRPLRHPLIEQISDDELARLATVQSLVEQRTLAIDQSSYHPVTDKVTVKGKSYSAQPPMLAALLAGPYWVMHRWGITFASNRSLVEYLLTVIGVTLPVAIAAGVIYRMGRVFELIRWKRACLALVVVFASGLISYATVLNSHAASAALVIASVAALVHVTVSPRPHWSGGWLGLSGVCAGLATTIEPAAGVFAVILIPVLLALRWPMMLRVAAVLTYLAGMLPAVLVHARLTVPIGGDIRPLGWHAELRPAAVADAGPEDETGASLAGTRRLIEAAIGEHGLLSHFPILVLGFFGIGAVMHRHWPMTTKLLAGGTAAGAAAIVLGYCLGSSLGAGSMFGARWFVVFVPLLVFWGGAWLRRGHRTVSWTIAGVLLAFSVAVSLIGATDPLPRTGYTRWSAGEAMAKLLVGDAGVEARRVTVAGGRD